MFVLVYMFRGNGGHRQPTTVLHRRWLSPRHPIRTEQGRVHLGDTLRDSITLPAFGIKGPVNQLVRPTNPGSEVGAAVVEKCVPPLSHNRHDSTQIVSATTHILKPVA